MPNLILLYCTTHDDGIIINSNNINKKKLCCEGSTTNICNFEYDGDNIEINKIQRNYYRHSGGFRFEYYGNIVKKISKL